MHNQIVTRDFPFLDDESKIEDEDHVKEIEGGQDNKDNFCNYSGDDPQKLSIHDCEGPHIAIEHQSEPMLVEEEVPDGTSTLAQQPSITLQGK